jgi:ABC-type glucose/galactose transport system permease subunit
MEPYAALIGSTDLPFWLVSTLVMIMLTLLIKFTRTGKAMRATAQDRKMALLVGINVDRIISITFIIGSALAAIGGLLIASHIGQINFYIGFIAGIKAFTPQCWAASAPFPARCWAVLSSVSPKPLPPDTSPAIMKMSLPSPCWC